MPEEMPPAAPKSSNPTKVREPDNTRPPGDPTPQKPMNPQEAGAADDEPATEGM